jgi:hypothetical protein
MSKDLMHRLRPSTCALTALALGALGLAASLLEAAAGARAEPPRASQALVRELGLTDPALFTEARYTRHRVLADLHAAFQEHPLAFDHFPSGSLLPPPAYEAPHE